jgi:hypothetical protein
VAPHPSGHFETWFSRERIKTLRCCAAAGVVTRHRRMVAAERWKTAAA